MTGRTSPRHVSASGSSTVLFVDDEAQACKWFARLFGDEFDVLTAGSTDEALAVLAARNGEIAVLITDYRMPTRDGLDLLRVAQRDHPQVMRLLATAYAEKEVALAAINQGRVLQILEKPFNDNEVRRALRDALARYRERERDQALLQGRAAAMRETLGFLAHELNTPLATVLGYMDVLHTRHKSAALQPVEANQPGVGFTQKEPQHPAARSDNTLTVIEAAARRTQYALSLVATFVQSARDAYPGARPAALQASELIRALLNDYPFEADERASVTCDLAGDFALPGQRDLLYLVLCTLTKNALFALRGQSQPQPNLHITLEAAVTGPGAAPQAVIRLSDNGPGMAPEILAKLTREPVTTRAAQGGSGMGLLFCRRVVQSMGGLIEISSAPGDGTSVTLLFKPDEHLERVDP